MTPVTLSHSNIYRGFTNDEQINAAYNPSLHNPLAPELIAAYAARSERTRRNITNRRGLRYGDHPRAILDFFPSGDTVAPLIVFVHGGYWRALSSDSFSFVADTFAQTGHHVAIINYPLLPEVTLPTQIAAVRSALAWLWQQHQSLNIVRDQISLAGHSAGGHLVACCLATNWPDYGLPKNPWARALCISGLFDLAPFPHSWLQPEVQFRATDVMQCSPVFQHIPTGCPTLTVVGEEESSEFARQSRLWQSRLQQQQPHHHHRCARINGHNHFSILDELAEGHGITFEFLRAGF